MSGVKRLRYETGNRDAMPVAMLATITHHSFHILGRVQDDADQNARLAAITAANQHAVVTADASWILSRMTRICEATSKIRTARSQAKKLSQCELESARRLAISQTIKKDTKWAT